MVNSEGARRCVIDTSNLGCGDREIIDSIPAGKQKSDWQSLSHIFPTSCEMALYGAAVTPEACRLSRGSP